jgi:CRP-like cAMP-binding protein
MPPSQLRKLIQVGGTIRYAKGELFHSLDFNEELYVVKSGFVKRYSISEDSIKTIESIYGPNYFFPLSPVFKNLFDYELNQKSNTYVYQAMTDIELHSISGKKLLDILDKKPQLYADLLYETGRRLRVDIDRLTSNALKDDERKIIHQLVCLAEEFGKFKVKNLKTRVEMPLPLEPLDLAEQLNITEKNVAECMNKLRDQGLITTKKDQVNIPDLELLRDAYLRF